MSFKELKKDFPIFAHHQRSGRDLVYLDSAATTQKPQCVIEALTQFYTTTNANINRGLYDIAEAATQQYENARTTVACFINAADPCEIIFTKGATEGINFVAHAWAMEHLKPGNIILLSHAEHHANLLPWQWIAEKTGATLTFIPYDSTTGYLKDPAAYLTPSVKLVAIASDSNVVGQLWQDGQLEAFIEQAHTLGAKVLVDAAQSVVHRPLDVQQLNTDFLVFSGHKMLGPTGIGVLYIKKSLHNQTEPYQRGGSMIHSATYRGASWAQAPAKFEAGTPPIAGAIALASAIEYINKNINFNELHNHEVELCQALIKVLERHQEITIAGNINHIKKHGYMVSFAVKGIHHHDLAAYLGQQGIAVRAGHLCAQPFVASLGFQGLIRVSFGAYNTQRDVEAFSTALEAGINMLATTQHGSVDV
ncbi:MAG: aminotransferase class V-fold PLP-dependent enzyme [Candidatus Babeliales bacterium]